MEWGQIVVLYMMAINIITFAVYGIDKWKARKGRWRIPEAMLLLCAAIGGSLGALFGMSVWHHKTKHLKFMIGVPVIFFLQVFLLGYYWIVSI